MSLQLEEKMQRFILNNRKVQLTGAELKDLLEGFSGQNLKSIEVIPNPPANFDAEGGPV